MIIDFCHRIILGQQHSGIFQWILAAPEESKKLQFDDYIDHSGLAPINVTNFNVSQHPGLCDVKWNRIVVEAGDTLFVPLYHPHHVYSPPGRNMAIGMWFNLAEYMSFYDDIDIEDLLSDDERILVSQMTAVYQVRNTNPIGFFHWCNVGTTGSPKIFFVISYHVEG